MITAVAQKVRLNLGGRETSIDGFLNVDLQRLSNVDIVADVRKLDMFETGSVDEIYASHLVEHFPWTETLGLLKEWRRVLRDGGVAYISVPDFAEMVTIYNKAGGLVQYVVEVLMGEHHRPFGGHMALFDFPRLSKFLMDAGFSDVHRLEYLPYGVKDCSHYQNNWNERPISVNVEAIA